VGVLEADTESAKPFLATEYVDGPSLAEHVGRCGPLAPGVLYGLATGLAEALVAIHAAGVIHRDLKPGNVLLTQAGPKVIDFGIAQALDATAVTRTGMTVGSPGFMAPEQIMGAGRAAGRHLLLGLDGGLRRQRRAPVRHRADRSNHVPDHPRQPRYRGGPSAVAAPRGGGPGKGSRPAAHRG
jgi:serine/threonine protein kinase